jgi:transcriptional regulator PpsR
LEYVLSDLGTSTLAALVEQAADFSLVLDDRGVVSELVVGSSELKACVDQTWVGRPWAHTAIGDGRSRIEDLLAAARAAPGVPVEADITHLDVLGAELPIQYRVVSEPEQGADRVVALGRDLRPVANLRQQLLNAQQALEQDYWRLRQLETRYRMLFDMVADAILVIDAASGRILEANPRAADLLAGGDNVIGRPFPAGFDNAGMAAVSSLLREAQAVGKGSAVGVGSANSDASFNVVASFLRQANESRFLVRLGVIGGDAAALSGAGEHYLPESLRRSPDAVLLMDVDGRIEAVNKTFLDLAQLVSEEQALGYSADRWLGRTGVDLNVLLANLRQRDSVRLFATALRGELGALTDVEISACRLSEVRPPLFAFFIRDTSRRISSEHPDTLRLPRSVEQVTQRVGRVPLKELVRESTDIIEALCIEAALKLTGDNRASAAELLGLSRQSLYAKLRRYDLGGPDSDFD